MGHCFSCTESIDYRNNEGGKKRRKQKSKKGFGLDFSPAKTSQAKISNELNINRYFIEEKSIGKDNFKLMKVIGRGSYGKVYLVE